MLNSETKRSIDAARDVLVGQVPDPKGQVEQITIALLYKFMDEIDRKSVKQGGRASFFVGDYKPLAWSNLMSETLGADERFALYRKGVEGMSDNGKLPDTFRGIFRGAFLSFNDPRTLRLFLKEVDGIQYEHSEDLGDAFEYLLSVLGSQGDAGQFRTPRHIIDFMVEVVSPKKRERILDPACGTAGFLISARKHIDGENSGGGRNPAGGLTPAEKTRLAENIVGYEISPDMVRLSLANMYLHGLKKPQVREYDTLTSDAYWDEEFDVILANPPFMTPKGGIRPHKRFAVAAKRAEVLFVDYIAEHLAPDGRAGVVVPEGIVFKSERAYKLLRKNLVEEWGLWAVVSLPAGVFKPYSGVKTSILLIDGRLAENTGEVLFVRAENDGFELGDKRSPIDKNDLSEALEVLKAWKGGVKRKSELALWVGKGKVAEGGDYNLTGERYREVEIVGHQKWPTVELGEVAKVGAGNSAPQNKEFFKDGKYPFCRVADVGRVHISDNFKEIKDFLNDKGIRGLRLHRKDTILFPKSGASTFLNHRVVLAVDSYVSSHLATIYADKNRILPKFLFNLLCLVDARSLTNDQSYPSLKLSTISKIKIPLPPLSVQKEIVEQIEVKQNAINHAREVIKNLERERRYFGQEVGKLKDVEMVELGEVCEFNPKKSGLKTLSKDMQVSFVPMSELNENQMDFEVKQQKKLEEVYSGYVYFAENDVLLARVTPCFENGKAGIARKLTNGIGFGSSEYFVYRANTKKILPEFLYYFIASDDFREQGKSNMHGTSGLQRLKKDYAKQYKIPLPSVAVQKQLVAEAEKEEEIISANRRLIKLMETKIQSVLKEI